MNIQIAGAGLWTRGLTCFDDLQSLCAQPDAVLDVPFVNPKPEAITAKERRRAGLMINLAVEVAHQACEHAGIDKQLPPSVFVSAMGDTVITDYMCRKLAAPEKLLSPTKFHNSVHNAPSGYWTISAGNRAPSSFVGGFVQSFGAGLLEAASQCLDHQQPVLMVAYDIANAMPFGDIEPVAESLGIALLVAPSELDLVAFAAPAATAQIAPCAAQLEYVVQTEVVETVPRHAALAELARANPVGGGLAVLEALAQQPQTAQTIALAAAPNATLQITLSAGAQL
ncbi:MAG: beta-ketoacyl synthase chain length factor [Pseudomonadales bacterium]